MLHGFCARQYPVLSTREGKQLDGLNRRRTRTTGRLPIRVKNDDLWKTPDAAVKHHQVARRRVHRGHPEDEAPLRWCTRRYQC